MRTIMIASLASLLTAGCATMEEPLAMPVCPTETRGWTAWINAMPGPGAVPTLIVTGEALMPEHAEAVLTAGPTDRMMPPGQRVALSVVPSDRAAGWQPVRLEITPAQSAYSSIVIGCGGNEVASITSIETAQ